RRLMVSQVERTRAEEDVAEVEDRGIGRFLGHHVHELAIDEIGEGEGQGLLELDLNSPGVDSGNVEDRRVGVSDVRDAATAGAAVGEALPAEDDVIDIDGAAADGRQVMELDVLAELKVDLHPVGRELPRFGDVGNDLVIVRRPEVAHFDLDKAQIRYL